MSRSAEIARIARFAVVGGVAFVAYYSCMIATINLANTTQGVAAGAGFIAGTAVSYIGNSVLVFQARPTAGNMFRFWVVTCAGFVLNVLIASVLEKLGFRPLFTALLIFLTVPVLNYLGHRFWSFREADLERLR